MSLAESVDFSDCMTAGVPSLQYLTFRLADEEYGVEILRVQEIKEWRNGATRLPRTPGYIKGVINIRGTIVPIVDLRSRFAIDSAPPPAPHVVIILRVVEAKKERVVGIVVDAVSDVLSADSDRLLPPPDVGNASDTAFIKGLVSVGERMLIALDIDRLLNDIAHTAHDESNISTIESTGGTHHEGE